MAFTNPQDLLSNIMSQFGPMQAPETGQEEVAPQTAVPTVGTPAAAPASSAPTAIEARKTKREGMRNLLGGFLANLGAGMSAAAQAGPEQAGMAGMGAAIQAPAIRKQQELQNQQRAQQLASQQRSAQALEALRQAQAVAVPLEQKRKQEETDNKVQIALDKINAAATTNQSKIDAAMDRLHETLNSRATLQDDAQKFKDEQNDTNWKNKFDLADKNNAFRLKAIGAQSDAALARAKVMAGMYGPDAAKVIEAAQNGVNTGQIPFNSLSPPQRAGVLLKNAEDGKIILSKENRKSLMAFNGAQAAVAEIEKMLGEFEQIEWTSPVEKAMRYAQLRRTVQADAILVGKALGEQRFTDDDRRTYSSRILPGILGIAFSPDEARKYSADTQELLNNINQREFTGMYEKYSDTVARRQAISKPRTEGKGTATTTAPAPAASSAVKVGDEKKFPNGKVGIWDGTGYVAK